MTLLQVIVLGIVQGLTEFLPISSSAHLRILPALFGWHFYHGTTNDPGAPFVAIMQLGAMLALVLYFWRELLQVIVAWVRGFVDRSVRGTLEYKLGWYLILATIPIAVLGLVFRHQITSGARNMWLLASTLIAVGALLYAAERVGSRDREEEDISTVDAAIVGAAQTLALVPGASRTGTTITAGLFRGLTREAAARFSFLLGIPAVVLASIYEAADPGHGHSPGAGLTGVALVLAFAVGLATIHLLLRWLRNHGTYVFSCYRIALGLLVIGLLSSGTLST